MINVVRTSLEYKEYVRNVLRGVKIVKWIHRKLLTYHAKIVHKVSWEKGAFNKLRCVRIFRTVLNAKKILTRLKYVRSALHFIS
jgi:hypothetical protein